MIEIDKSNYCVHGKTIKKLILIEGNSYCQCCGNFIDVEIKGLNLIFCKWCMSSPIKKELI